MAKTCLVAPGNKCKFIINYLLICYTDDTLPQYIILLLILNFLPTSRSISFKKKSLSVCMQICVSICICWHVVPTLSIFNLT